MNEEALFLLRAVVGVLMAAHGSQKLFGWLGGHGLAGTAGYMEMIGFRPGRPFALLAASGEFFGGLLMALGLFGPIGPAAVLSVMIVAAVTVHWHNGLFVMTNGIEVPLLYAAAAVALGLTGPGALSLDAMVGLTWTPALSLAALAIGIVGAFAALAIRRPLPQAVTN